jgi:lipopolysaccharide/colanic/teichoic acid biosynthesis glycosyltransferase
MKFEDSVTKLENCGDALVVAHNRSYGAYEVGKRTLDVLSPLFEIVGFSWFFALIALAIKLDDSQEVVIFRQTRVGKKGDRTFSMWKFRSMCSDAKERLAGLMRYNEKDGPAFKMAHNPRDTRVGHFICKTSLDELPQFFNVLFGQMPIVGSHRALPSEVAQYAPYQPHRLLCDAGITSYWQVQRNRDSLTFNEWVGLLYVKTRSFFTDLKLIFRTVGMILIARGY